MKNRKVSRQSDPVSAASTFFATYGTVAFLVDANNAAEVELRIRVDCFDRYTDPRELRHLPVVRRGAVFVRRATDDDVLRHEQIKRARKSFAEYRRLMG